MKHDIMSYKMESLLNKLTELVSLLKVAKQEGLFGSSLPNIPSIKPPSPPKPPSMKPPKKKTKLPGVAPDSKKDPKKIAEQIKNGAMSTKTQKVMLKNSDGE